VTVDLLADLGWLPRPPINWRELSAQVLDEPSSAGVRLAELATFGHDENGLVRLAGIMRKARTKGVSLAPLRPYRLGIVSNATTGYLLPAISATGARHGLAIECVAGDYGQIMQEVLSADSNLNRARPDAVLVALDWRGLPLQAHAGDADGVESAVRRASEFLAAIQAGIRKMSLGVCIFQTLAPPPQTAFGSMEPRVSGTVHHLVAALNTAIGELVTKSGSDVILDIATLASATGLTRWHSPMQWNLAKIPFAQEYVPLYADHLCRLLGALCGRSRRCLVLDLDNTLWGGVIGDDGLAGIVLGQGDPVGEAYADFQRYLLTLRDRGVVLAVCSKNDDAVARLPFREHSEMLIREEHIAVFQANWNDKASNIRAIAQTLNLGLESFAFADDNPFEREQVRRALPQVAVLELPADPALYALTLSAAGLFESVQFTAEDRKRADYYAGNARRAAVLSEAGDIKDYLASLDMEITFQPFDATGRARIVQLINKSNQFNLTTRRYSEADVAGFELDPDIFTMQVRLSDVFGDNGMISVIICRPAPDLVWNLDLWLMSCRVLGRGVEVMVLREILEHARNRRVRSLAGEYIPTGRNALVENHYRDLGFALTEETAGGGSRWSLPVEGTEPPSPPIRVRKSGFAENPAPREAVVEFG
jgi:FkbH-like protein